MNCRIFRNNYNRNSKLLVNIKLCNIYYLELKDILVETLIKLVEYDPEDRITHFELYLLLLEINEFKLEKPELNTFNFLTR